MPGGYAIFVDQIPPTGVPVLETVWRAEETGIDIAAGTSYSRAFDTGTSPAGMGAGRYEVFSALRSSAGKDLAAAYAFFIVAPKEGYVSVTTDKTHYQPEEEMLIEAAACNVSSQNREYTLELWLGNEGNLPVENMEVTVSMESSALAEPLAQIIAVPWIAAAWDGEPGCDSGVRI